ncbi:hypothetical protein AM506_18750 [Rossellomorea vietnamensis]|uniref:Uncharacterized protein n=1 Tax=Rossellomorea vietnamensis TaxID=218284 RepID=A0A0P6WB92_9BACI|nr:hypothetical protein AM506_18750 [Rossellomorea vietnamensis]
MLVGPDRAASAFSVIQLQGLEARGHKPSLPKRQRTPFRQARLMLVASGQSPSAFSTIQLRRLVPRGHKLNGPRRQRTPSQPIHLMLVGPDRAASAFSVYIIFQPLGNVRVVEKTYFLLNKIY